ncbi:uncharacterized protein LOC5518121 [Nematostella vectensis]|nr:uncharacterized protein LOC5518121 [Nematostella vectensis]
MARVGPSHVREMEGVLSQEGEATLGVLVNNIGFTSLAYEHFMSSPLPLIFVVITDRHRLSLVSGITLTKKLDSHDKLGQTKLKWQLQADAVCGGSKEKDKVLNHDAATDRTLDCNDQQQNMANQQTPQNNCGKKVIERNSDAYDGWRLSLFELNPPARTLLPNLVIGLTMGTDGHRVPNLMALTL